MSLCEFDNSAVCRVCGRPARHGNVYRECRQPPVVERKAASRGPGSELKKLLASFGITATPSCSCNAGAALMDELEARFPGWCEGHIDEIVGWMRKEAAARGLPFLDVVGRLLVRRAVRNARQNLPG